MHWTLGLTGTDVVLCILIRPQTHAWSWACMLYVCIDTWVTSNGLRFAEIR